jgi:hypothetical protein
VPLKMRRGSKQVMRKRRLKTPIGFRSDLRQPLFCSDIVFALLTFDLNSMSEIVYNFTRETKILNSLVENISFDEKRSMTLRAYLAKENAIELNNEI